MACCADSNQHELGGRAQRDRSNNVLMLGEDNTGGVMAKAGLRLIAGPSPTVVKFALAVSFSWSGMSSAVAAET
jgi:hypothetical protein